MRGALRKWLPWPLGCIAASAALGRPVARAEAVDPRLATVVTIGPPRGAAPMARVDAHRTGRSREPLPDAPRLLWRHPLNEALDALPLAVDEAGAVVVASPSSSQITEVGADGVEHWRIHVASPAVSGPVLLSDSTRLVVTAGSELVGITREGAVRFRSDLARAGRAARVAPLPLEDGGALVAVGAEIDELTADGSVRSTTPLPERAVGALVRSALGVVATGESGAVYRIRPPEPARRLGSFEGEPGPGATAQGRSLLAVVDHRRLVTLDLATGIASTSYSTNVASLDGPIALGPSHVALFTTFHGALVSVDATGQGIRRTQLEGTGADGAAAPGNVVESPAVITDPEGRVGFARVGGAMGTVSPTGSVTFAEGASCAMPVALAPGGSRRMVVACRDGVILMLGD